MTDNQYTTQGELFANIVKRGRGRNAGEMSKEEIGDCVRRYNSGEPLYKLAVSYRRSSATIRECLEKAGVELAPVGKMISIAASRRWESRRKAILTVGEKACSKCGVVKALSEFHRTSKKKLGVASSCKDCIFASSGARKRYAIPNLQIEPELLGYLAGLIDGEGWVGMTRRKLHLDRWCYSVRIAIGMSGTALTNLCEELGFGRIIAIKKKQNRKTIRSWYIGTYACHALLPLLIPHLRFKKKQAELLLQTFSVRWDIEKIENGTQQKEMERIYREVKRLNSRCVDIPGRDF